MIFEIYLIKLNKKKVPEGTVRLGVASTEIFIEGSKNLKIY